MDLVVSAPDGRDIGSTSRFDLDLSFGDGGNNFELSCPDLPISRGCLVSIDGTEYGGVVDAAEQETEGGETSVVWKGRTWQGVLAAKVLEPDRGQDYLHVSGDANAVLTRLIARMGLQSLFAVPKSRASVSVDHTFERYTDGYAGIRKMLRASSAKLMLRREDGITRIWAEPIRQLGDAIDSDLIDFTAERMWRPVNHLVCLGTGELRNRTVLHLYADDRGNVSERQSLFGADEVAETYDYSNADMAKLREDGTKKLREYQQQGAVDVSVADGLELYVGDVVTGSAHGAGVVDGSVTAPVVKKIVRARDGAVEVSYEVGDAQTSSRGGIHGSAEHSGGGGASLSAGDGITITGGRISADVTQTELDAVDAKADRAVKTASDASAAVGGAVAKAEAAQAAADSKVSGVTATGGLGSSTADHAVTITHDLSGVTAGSYGLAGDVSVEHHGTVPVPCVTVDERGHVTRAETHMVRMPPVPETVQAAERLSRRRRVTISGAVNGSAEWDGSTDLAIYTVGDSEQAGFLAAHPVGSILETAIADNPSRWGGEWTRLPSLGAFTWERTA
ncbi:MAG: hypothetical protein Q4B30_06285 [Coriobacteriaceae bacterium]|nr:hypothetical protein [Coriobacteriaceae bacterium]